MKKRLLISSVLMSAVLACALGTGTYAWYSAGTAAAGLSAESTGHIETKEDYDVTGASFDVEWGEWTEIALSNNAGKSYHLEGGVAVEDASAVVEAKNTFTISWDSNATPGQQAAAVGSYTVTLTPSANVRLSKSAKGTNGQETAEAITFTITVAPDGTISGGEQDFYYAIRATKTDTTGSSLTAEEAHTADTITIAVAAA